MFYKNIYTVFWYNLFKHCKKEFILTNNISYNKYNP